MLELPIEHASAKTRVGGPIEDPDDLTLDVWGGVVPVTTTFGAAVADGQGAPDPALPPSLVPYRRPTNASH